MRKPILIIALLAIIAAIVVISPPAQRLVLESEWGYRTLTPANLTGEKGIHTFGDDDLQYSRGSLVGTEGAVYENANIYQGTYEFWSRRNVDDDDNAYSRYLTLRDSANSQLVLYKDPSNRLTILRDGGVGNHVFARISISTWNAVEWHYIVATWDSNNYTNGTDYLTLYADGIRVAGSGTALVALPTIPATFYLGSSDAGSEQFNGVIAGRILNRPLTAAEVTALYAAGAGSLDSTVIDADVVWRGNYSDDTTSATYWPFGQSVDSTTASQVTLAEAVGLRTWANNIAVAVSDGTGYSVDALINEPGGILAADTTLELDNIAPAELAQVGVYADIDGDSQFFYRTDANFPESGILADMTIQYWINWPNAAGPDTIVSKWGSPNNMYLVQHLSDEIRVYISSDGTTATSSDTSSIDIQANTWTHIAVVYDAGAGTLDFYKNGMFIEQEVGQENSIADKAPNFIVGWSAYIEAKIANMALFDDKRTPAEILASALDRSIDLSGEGNIIGQWQFWEAAAAAAIDNTQGDAGRDLIPYDGGDVTFNALRGQSAFISKNLFTNPGFESANIGAISDASIDSTITVSSDATVVKFDTSSLLIDYTASNDNVELELRDPILTNGGDYYYRMWWWTDSIADDSGGWFDVDGAGNVLSREVANALGDNGEFDRSFDLDATYFAQAANNTIHDVALEDISFSALAKIDIDGTGYITDKRISNTNGYGSYVLSNGKFGFTMRDGTDSFTLNSIIIPVDDDDWHHLAVVIDRDNVNNCKLYCDGVDVSDTPSGTLADVDSLTNATLFMLGVRSALSSNFPGQLADAKIYIAAGAHWSDAEILSQAQNPFRRSPAEGTLTDAWYCRDNAASTVVAGSVNDLTASANTDTFADTQWKMFEGTFSGDQNGAHNLNLRVTGAGAGANAATVYTDQWSVIANMVAAGDCEAADGNALPTGWSDTGGPDADETQTDTADFHSGASSILLNAADTDEGAYQDITVVVDQYYTLSWFEKNNAADVDVDLSDAVTATLDSTGDNTWTGHRYTFKATTTTLTLKLVSGAAAQSGWFDDISVIVLDEAAASTDTKGSGHYPKGNPHILPLD